MNKNHKRSSENINHSLLQKNYGNPKPVRIADTGQDPESGFLKFMKNDIIKPLQRSKLHTDNSKVEKSDKWALDTQKKCQSIEKLPKVQQFKEYYFPQKNSEQEEKYKTTFIPTDHIAINIPKIFKTEDKDSFLNLKKKFGKHTETIRKGWAPLDNNTKSLGNLSSVGYNILSHQHNPVSGAVELKLLDKKLANRKKSIGEIYDLTMNFNPKINHEFRSSCDSNKSIFHIRTGIFSQMYDNAHRNGNISVPFRNNNSSSSPIKNK